MSDFVEDGLREHQATNDVMLGLLAASQRQQNLKQPHTQTQELQPPMKPLPLLALTLGFILCTMGFSPDRQVSGQVFVVTKGRENVKMGLVPIHAVTAEQLAPIAAELLKTYKQADLKKRQALAQQVADLAALRQFENELGALQPVGLNLPEFRAWQEESAQRRSSGAARDTESTDSEALALRASLFARLPVAEGKTDADGRFNLNLKSSPKVWLLAQAERTTGEDTERYFWAHAVKDGRDTNPVLLSNDSLVERGLQGFLDFLADNSTETQQPLPLSQVTPNPEIIQWAKTNLASAGPVAKLATEKAAAEAKASAEKRLEWTGKAMQRAGMKAETVKRTLTQGGTVVAWGDNREGQRIVPAGLSGVVAIAAGDQHTVALKQDGTVVAWGSDSFGITTVPWFLSRVVALAAGGLHTVALKQDGTVVAWGYNFSGQTTVPAGLSGVVAIAAGGDHTLALKKDGTVVAWGGNGSGQTKVPAVLMSGVVAIAAGGLHTVALKQDGTIVAWGYNKDGPTKVPAGLSGVVAIAAGGYHTVALKKDGTVVAWGDNDKGQTTVPAGLSGVVAIAAGEYHTVALKLPE